MCGCLFYGENMNIHIPTPTLINISQLKPYEKNAKQHNATQAAILAGYSTKTARAIESENLTKPDIKNFIMSRQACSVGLSICLIYLTLNCSSQLCKYSSTAPNSFRLWVITDIVACSSRTTPAFHSRSAYLFL